MCMGCYEEAGVPRVITPKTLALAKRIEAANHYGALHIVIEDWNLEDDNITFCRDEPHATEEERALAADLLAMTDRERASAMALADGYLLPDGNLSQFAEDCLARAEGEA